MNKHMASRLAATYVRSVVQSGPHTSELPYYSQQAFTLANQRYIDFVKSVNEWLKSDKAAWLFDTTITKADGKTLYTREERYGLCRMLNADYTSSINDNYTKYYQAYEDQGLIESKDWLQELMGQQRIYPVDSVAPVIQPDGSSIFDIINTHQIEPSQWTAKDCNPDDGQVFLFKWYNMYTAYTNYAKLRLNSKHLTPFVAYRDIENTDKEVYIPQLAWTAFTVGLEDSGCDIIFDHLDVIDYIDSLSIRVSPPFVLA